MPVITLTTEIAATVDVVFDLSRSIDLHVESTSQTNEKAIAGRTSGLIELGETVTWEATHFLIRQRLTVRIEQFDRPNYFRDSMVAGAFSRFDHDHHFESCRNGTIMTDVFDFTSPYGPLGRVANWLFVTRHLRRLLATRNQLIKSIAESGDVQKFTHPAEYLQRNRR
jgi:ligand-binding SRPBCC domain-containing protein